MEAMVRAAPVAMGERSRSRTVKLLGADPAGQFIVLADGQRDRRGFDGGIVARARFQAHGLLAFVRHRRIDRTRAAQHRPARVRFVKRSMEQRCGAATNRHECQAP